MARRCSSICGIPGRALLSTRSVVVFLAALCIVPCPDASSAAHVEETKMSKTPLARKDAFFGLHFDLHPHKADTVLGADASEENILALLDRVRPDYIQWDCKGHAGYTGYPTRVGWPSPGIVKDSLRIVRDATRKRGVGLFVHYSGVWGCGGGRASPGLAAREAGR